MQRRAGRGRLNRAGPSGLSSAVPNAATLSIGGSIGPDRSHQHGSQACQPARWYRGEPPAFSDRVTRTFCADHCGKVMGREADTPFRQRQSERCLHRSAQPGIGVRSRGQFPSFIPPRMRKSASCRRASNGPQMCSRGCVHSGDARHDRHQRRQQSRVEFGINRPKKGGRLVQFADELGQGFTGFFRPKFRSPSAAGSADNASAADMCGQ